MDTTPEELRSRFNLHDDVYILGSFETGLTVYRQQVRAHNLAWALADSSKTRESKRLAVIGGGIGGLTVAAGLATAMPDTEIYLFERRSQFCALQLGCDTRWLHPRIYDWPKPGSQTPNAGLPLLDWSAGRASDVAHKVLKDFCLGAEQVGSKKLKMFTSVEHLQIQAGEHTVEWVGKGVYARDGFFRADQTLGMTLDFDLIVVAAGFGMEGGGPLTPSYWRNETFGQPVLDGSVNSYVISGYGDGALVDLCRLTIERFRQDRIIGELFGIAAEPLEQRLNDELQGIAADEWFQLLERLERTELKGMADLIRGRLRRDIKVGMHLAGADKANRVIGDAFGGKASFANRMLFFLLFRCGAFSPVFGDLAAWAESNRVPEPRRVLRYGADVETHVKAIFKNPSVLESRIRELRSSSVQTSELVVPMGFFESAFRSD